MNTLFLLIMLSGCTFTYNHVIIPQAQQDDDDDDKDEKSKTKPDKCECTMPWNTFLDECCLANTLEVKETSTGH